MEKVMVAFRTLRALIIASPLLLLMAGCGALYKVKPVVEGPLPDTAREAEAGALRLRAAPLFADEESQELFEANLPLAGLLPIRVEIINGGDAPVDIKSARFRLRDAEGQEWKFRTARQAVSRILTANKITLYNPRSRAQFEEAIKTYALDTTRPLAPSERRRGLIFFQTAKKEAVRNPPGLILSVEKLQQPLEVRLN